MPADAFHTPAKQRIPSEAAADCTGAVGSRGTKPKWAMTASDSNIKRMFQQLYDAAVLCFTKPKQKPKPKPYALGMAISFITTTLAATKQLTTDGRLPTALKSAQESVVADAITRGELKIASKYQSRTAAQVYGHLRNCFAHCNWSYDESKVSKANLAIRVQDYYPPKKGRTLEETFDATIELPPLLDLAEKLLFVTFNGMP